MHLRLDKIEALYDEFDTLVRVFKPAEVEYLVVFLTTLIPQITTNIATWAPTHRDCSQRLHNFVSGINELFRLLQTYHRAGRVVNETKLLGLHLDMLVTLKTEVCYVWKHRSEPYQYTDLMRLLREYPENTGLESQAFILLRLEFPNSVQPVSNVPLIIHASLGSRLFVPSVAHRILEQ